MAAIHANPGRAWTVNDLAELSNLSRSAFADRFQRVVGQAPLSYLTTWRLDRAAELLRYSRAPISDIASRVGYTSEAAFSRAFKGRYSRRGRLNSIRFGSPQSEQYLLAYDKQMEQRSREIEEFSASRIEARGARPRRISIPRTRFELRLVGTRRLDALSEARNAFSDFHVAQYGGAQSVLGPHEAAWFEDSVGARGMQAALALISDRRLRRRVAEASVLSGTPAWWNPEEIWGELPAALRRVFL